MNTQEKTEWLAEHFFGSASRQARRVSPGWVFAGLVQEVMVARCFAFDCNYSLEARVHAAAFSTADSFESGDYAHAQTLPVVIIEAAYKALHYNARTRT